MDEGLVGGDLSLGAMSSSWPDSEWCLAWPLSSDALAPVLLRVDSSNNWHRSTLASTKQAHVIAFTDAVEQLSSAGKEFGICPTSYFEPELILGASSNFY